MNKYTITDPKAIKRVQEAEKEAHAVWDRTEKEREDSKAKYWEIIKNEAKVAPEDRDGCLHIHDEHADAGVIIVEAGEHDHGKGSAGIIGKILGRIAKEAA